MSTFTNSTGSASRPSGYLPSVWPCIRPSKEELFIMRFSDGSATGQLKGIKKDASGAWLVCDLTADGNDVVASTCVSMATFSLTGVSLDDLLFVELYLKGHEGNTLWKWYMNLHLDLQLFDEKSLRVDSITPGDGSKPSSRRYVVAKLSSGTLGEEISVTLTSTAAATLGAATIAAAGSGFAGTIGNGPGEYQPLSKVVVLRRDGDSPLSPLYRSYSSRELVVWTEETNENIQAPSSPVAPPVVITAAQSDCLLAQALSVTQADAPEVCFANNDLKEYIPEEFKGSKFDLASYYPDLGDRLIKFEVHPTVGGQVKRGQLGSGYLGSKGATRGLQGRVCA